MDIINILKDLDSTLRMGKYNSQLSLLSTELSYKCDVNGLPFISEEEWAAFSIYSVRETTPSGALVGFSPRPAEGHPVPLLGASKESS